MCVTVVATQSNSDPSPRGTKRSRSPDDYGGYTQAEAGEDHSVFALGQTDLVVDDSKPRKRGRPAKTPRTSGDFTNDQSGALPTPSSQASPGLVTTPTGKSQVNAVQPVLTPTQASPGPKPKSTLKALPTVRDHTSDQLGPGGDEFIPRERDEQGDTKVNDMGYLQGGREYRIRVFQLPGRGEKLFMLATECARTLQYRDSYLLFNKNRSLYKIIASPKEKEQLVTEDILPYSYRSRQIALVTAKSMFRQFGSRVIKDGRRVRDDYWEAKARKQGFTEDDPAGEKRPGAARAREEAAAAVINSRQLTNMYGNIVYADDNGNFQTPSLPPGMSSSLPQMSMYESYDARYRDIPRPRVDNVGLAYTDITRTSNEAEMISQTNHAADQSKQLNHASRFRRGIVSDYWHRPHDPPVSTPQQINAELATAQSLPSPSYDANDVVDQHSGNISSSHRPSQTAMNPPSTFPNIPNAMNSPSRAVYQTPGHQNTQPRHPSGLSNVTPSQNMSGNYGYSPMAQQQGWGGPPPQPSPSPSISNRMYTQQSSSPHIPPNQIPSPMHTQSPHPQQQQQQQMQNAQHFQQMQGGNMNNQQLLGAGAGLRAMNVGGYNNMGMNPQMFAQMNQNFIQQQQQQQQQQHGSQPQQNMYGQQQWQNYQ